MQTDLFITYPKKTLKVLVACEFSGTVRDAFIAQGHDAMSCDLLPTERPGPHYQGDVMDILHDGWDMMIAHPPCTYLANSGVRWLHSDIERWPKMFKAADFYNRLKNAPIKKKAVENPIHHKYARALVGRQNGGIYQPWNFGDNESKAIAFHLEGLPPLVRRITKKPSDVTQRVWKIPPGPNRQKERSRFFPGIADAMATQWGGLFK